ncbi:amidase [Phyllobacterium phragmitis]|uniref:Indoleacetamide hydrolase n=1 Tax=Phyllobacterium phragmitis TaxID=2670329 RepID=A0A2S9IR69_9HYPH|nr:amidase [Phyllobacterium phragmitis]PRD43013.1 amidase [Phyllobacterium phragmitis]
MHHSNLDYASAAQTSRVVRQRKISPVEVIEHAISRIEARDPSLNAFAHTDFDQARSRAKQLEARILAGDDVGPLAGVPTAMKDLFNFYPGWPSTFGGVPALKNFRLNQKSIYPSRMEDAGAIVLGTTNSPTFGFRGTTDNALHGPTRNPFDLRRNSGGSSGGSAAAVADGLLPFADGTDGGGSIRIPSAWCHVFGFQPSFGRVPVAIRPNAFGGTAPFIYQGPIARTVEDAALALSVLAGPDVSDPFSISTKVDWSEALKRPITGLRIGFTPDFGGFPVEPTVAAKVAEAVLAFQEAGAEIVPLSLSFAYSHHQLSDLWCRMISQGAVAVLENFASQGMSLQHDLPETVREWAEKARNETLAELQDDQIMRSDVYCVLNEALEKVDFIAGPTTTCLPVRNAERGQTVGPDMINGMSVNPLIGFCPTFLTNFSGNPAASLPAGLADGLPVGLMLIGRLQQDANLLAACAAFEQVRPWMETYQIPAFRGLALS